eukprot:UN05904
MQKSLSLEIIEHTPEIFALLNVLFHIACPDWYKDYVISRVEEHFYHILKNIDKDSSENVIVCTQPPTTFSLWNQMHVYKTGLTKTEETESKTDN